MPDLVLIFLLVSCLSWVLQVLALARLVVQRARTPAEELVGGGYVRTVACRVLVATTYVAVAAVQLAGRGTLSAEALIVWIATQSIWLLNSLLDIRIRRTLSRLDSEGDRPVTDAPRDQLASIAAVTDDLDRILDKLFVTASELKVILARTRTGNEADPR